MKKKAPDQKAQSHNTQANHSIPPRMMRLALALLENPAGVPREVADKIAPASNGPHYIGQLRARRSRLPLAARIAAQVFEPHEDIAIAK